METLVMSGRERRRLDVLGRVQRGELSQRKASELLGLSDLAAANAYLAKEFLGEFNQQFMVAPAAKGDLHRRVPAGVKLDQVLAFREERVVQRDGALAEPLPAGVAARPRLGSDRAAGDGV